MFSSTLVIGVAFIPLFTLTGVAGVIFSPMAHTYAFAIGGAIILALTLTPAMAARFLRVDTGPREPTRLPVPLPLSPHLGEISEPEPEHESALMRLLERLYRPLFRFNLRRKGTEG
jgi:cobalt-zinc-cadmium resistance protein CzcA